MVSDESFWWEVPGVVEAFSLSPCSLLLARLFLTGNASGCCCTESRLMQHNVTGKRELIAGQVLLTPKEGANKPPGKCTDPNERFSKKDREAPINSGTSNTEKNYFKPFGVVIYFLC